MQGQGQRGGAPRPREQSSGRTMTGTLRDLEIASAGQEWTDEIRHLVHELEIHRTELEMQNQQLRESRAQLEDSNARYTDLYDFAPVAYLTLDASGKIEEANLTAAALFRIERGQLIGRAAHDAGQGRIAAGCCASTFKPASARRCACRTRSRSAPRSRFVVPTQITSTPDHRPPGVRRRLQDDADGHLGAEARAGGAAVPGRGQHDPGVLVRLPVHRRGGDPAGGAADGGRRRSWTSSTPPACCSGSRSPARTRAAPGWPTPRGRRDRRAARARRSAGCWRRTSRCCCAECRPSALTADAERVRARVVRPRLRAAVVDVRPDRQPRAACWAC